MDIPAIASQLRTHIRPRAEAIDRDPQALAESLAWLGEQGWLALRAPQIGGLTLSGVDYWRFQLEVAASSGALAFLQTQHQSAVALLAAHPEAVRAAHLADTARGDCALGVSFAHLRRPDGGLQAIADGSTYRLQGMVPWLTGYGFFRAALVAARLPDRSVLLAWVPLTPGSGLGMSEPLELLSMGVTGTVRLNFDHWRLPAEDVVAHLSADWLEQRDRRSILAPTAFNLGCACAALDWLETQAAPAAETAQALWVRWHRLHQRIGSVLAGEARTWEEQLALRVAAIALMQQASQAALAAASGAANTVGHPAQRYYREALAFSVLGQTAVVRQACLRSIASQCHESVA